MKGSVRYIITRPCLSEGSVRLLKYLEAVFPADGPVTLLDERGAEHQARVDRAAGRVYGLQDLYHRHNLGVNDVLLITPLGEARFQVECVVKPLSDRTASLNRARPSDAPQRVVVSESPYVREVRLERRGATSAHFAEQTASGPLGVSAGAPEPSRTVSQQAPLAQSAPPAQPTPAPSVSTLSQAPVASEKTVASDKTGASEKARLPRLAAPAQSAPAQSAPAAQPKTVSPAVPALREAASVQRTPDAPASTAPGRTTSADSVWPAGQSVVSVDVAGTEETLRELAQRVGYRLERLAEGVMRLKAELGTQSYSVLIALDLNATSRPEWRSEADYLTVIVNESERPQGLPRLTREALGALLENARLAQLSPIELRGYWNAGSFDLESAASVAELVSAQLSQRGVFSFVLLSLAQQPAHSVVTTARLAERLGSGVNIAELKSVLETLSSAPFSALSPLGNGQYYLRADVHDMLRGLGEYAEGLRVRLNAETRVSATLR